MWKANFIDTPDLILGYLFRIPGFIIINTLIPLLSAYAVQAILQKDVAHVDRYAWAIVGLGLLYAIFVYVGEGAIIRNAMKGSEYVQRQVFENYLRKDYEFYSNAYFGALGSKAVGLRDAFNQYGELLTLTIPRQFTIVVTSVAIIAWHSWQLALATVILMSLVQ